MTSLEHWVTQAVATVAEPPTSDPNTPAIALTIVASIAYLPCPYGERTIVLWA